MEGWNFFNNTVFGAVWPAETLGNVASYSKISKHENVAHFHFDA